MLYYATLLFLCGLRRQGNLFVILLQSACKGLSCMGSTQLAHQHHTLSAKTTYPWCYQHGRLAGGRRGGLGGSLYGIKPLPFFLLVQHGNAHVIIHVTCGLDVHIPGGADHTGSLNSRTAITTMGVCWGLAFPCEVRRERMINLYTIKYSNSKLVCLEIHHTYNEYSCMEKE